MKFASTLLAGLLILAAPWPIGGNYLYVRTVVLVLAAIFGVMAALTCLVERRKYRTSILWLLLPVAAGYAIFQTLSISGPISTYPSASLAQVYVLGSAIGLFLSSVILFRDTKTIEPLLACMAIVGFAVAFVGVVQKLGWNGKILWVYELLYGGAPFGPFVNRNNAAGFLILTLSGPLYFLARQFLPRSGHSRNSSHNNRSELSFSDEADHKKFRPVHSVFRFLANLEARHLYCLTGLIGIVAGVFFTLSRGGTAGAVLGLAIGLMMLMVANRWAVVLAGILIASCIGAAIWTEQADDVSASLTSITETTGDSPRFLHWKDAIPYYETFWMKGSGLGTYRYEYPVFQQQSFQGKFAHAENIFLETLAELGVVGVSALLITIFILLYASVSLLRQRRIPDQALGVAGISALIGLTTASCLDFGIYQPANFIVAAILFGSVLGRAGHPDCRVSENQTGNLSTGKYYRFCVLCVSILASAYSAIPSAAIESVHYAKRQISLHTKYRGDNIHRLRRAANSLEFAKKHLPQDWETEFLLGECEIYKHRLALTDQVQEETEAAIRLQAAEQGLGEEQVEEQLPTREEYWITTSMMNLHRVMRFAEVQNSAEFNAMRQDPTVVSHELRKAWGHFNKALELCDRSEKIHFRLAQMTVLLEKKEGNREIEAAHIDNALQLAKGFTGLAYEAGMLCMHTGNFEKSADLWSSCLQYNRQFESQIVKFGVGLPAKLYFEKVLPQNPEDLLRLSRIYFSEPELRVPNELLLVHARRLIKSAKLDDVQKSVLTGRAWYLAKEYQKACDEFEVALNSRPERPKWRLDYAKALVEVGRYDDAIRELKICQLDQPDRSARISRLIEKTKNQRVIKRRE